MYASWQQVRAASQPNGKAAMQKPSQTVTQPDSNAARQQRSQMVYLVSIPVRGFCSSSNLRATAAAADLTISLSL